MAELGAMLPDPGPQDAGLREVVLAGRHFGAGAPASAMAEFLAESDAGAILRGWMGRSRLARLAASGPDRKARLEEALDRDIAALDAAISRQLDAILHQPRLTRMEGSWRGLHWLVEGFVQDRLVKVRLLTLRWQELARDLERAAEFDQSTLFRLIYEDEFGTPGGEPYGMLAADFEIRPGPAAGHPVDDVAVLGQLSAIGAAAFCPIVMPAAPALLGLDDWHDASTTVSLSEVLRAPERTRWRSLAGREDTRFLALVLPRVLGRAAWRDDGTRADRFRYREDAGHANQRVWTTPVYALASVAARAFARYRWPAEIRGAEPGWEALGGVVETLPHERFRADPPGPPPRPPLELSLTDDQEREAADGGMVAFCGLDALPEASFGAVPSLHRPPRMTTQVADANQRISAQLNSVLCVSRFAHVVKLMGRDMVGSFLGPDEVELRLQQWLNRHITGLAGGGDAAARYPLRDARVEVRERPGRPGAYGCTMTLQPHYQLDEVGASFRLVTDLAAPRAAA
ncbi:type VI secretion system contractile sheath large subunit [Roseococcus sp. YIM B11640]|uniref:type VI secretion system contractile sheath large subunit n=1 Tax=Roseococcus sp. YIM B11640 TaxID=3133973 RepID=UPI003C7AD033